MQFSYKKGVYIMHILMIECKQFAEMMEILRNQVDNYDGKEELFLENQTIRALSS